jgi:splicing factor 3A subunit 3
VWWDILIKRLTDTI